MLGNAGVKSLRSQTKIYPRPDGQKAPRPVSEQPERLYLRIAEFVGQSYRDSDHKNPET